MNPYSVGQPTFGANMARWKEWVVAACIIFLMPIALIATIPNLLGQAGMLDPFIYTAYIHDYKQTYAYFGTTYYSNRISAIYPGRFFSWLLGAEPGYYAVRYLLLVMGGASIYAVGRRFYSASVGAFATVMLCFSPWYVRSLAWDYVDGFGITYLLAAIALLVVPNQRVGLAHALAGFLFALAANSNLYTLAIAGAFVPAWLILRAGEKRRRLLALMACCFIGFAFAYILLGFAVRVEFPDRPFFFEWTTLAMAKFLLEGGSAQYFEPLAAFFEKRNYQALTPIIVFLALLGTIGSLKARGHASDFGRFACAALVYLGTTIVIYLLNHFWLHAGRITLFYYFSYALVGSYLAVVALVGEISARVPAKIVWPALASTALLFIGGWSLFRARHASDQLLVLWAAVAVAMLVAVSLPRRPLIQLGSILAFLLALPIAFYCGNRYSDYLGLLSTEHAARNWEVYRSAVQFQRELGSTITPQDGKVRFWYVPRPMELNSIQSMYLWGFSRITGMPHIDSEFLKKLEGIRFLVLLAGTDNENSAGLTAMSKARIAYRIVRRDGFDGKVWSFRYVIIDLLPKPRP